MAYRPWTRLNGRNIFIAVILLFVVYLAFWKRHVVFGTFDKNNNAYFRSSLWSSNRHVELADHVKWSDFAYCTYATEAGHLCNSLMLLESLHRLGAQADRLLTYSHDWDVTATDSVEASLLRKARDLYGVRLQPVEIIRAQVVSDATWAAGFTKWLAFNQTEYKRVVALDSDGTILRSMDELFLMPPTPVALPRAYWLEDALSAQVAVVQPSTEAFAAIQREIEDRGTGDFDMEIINGLYGHSCGILPHRPYNLLTGEFRSENHSVYLGGTDEEWDAERIMEETAYLHFSDWPLPKPWEPHAAKMMADLMPKCKSGERDCADRRVWLWLYDDFRSRRKSVCGVEFADWEAVEARMKEASKLAIDA